jgi:hypothetical protein
MRGWYTTTGQKTMVRSAIIINRHKLTSRIGDVMYLEAFGQPMLVLDSTQAVSDLLEKRGATFSSRMVPRYVTDLWVDILFHA